MGEMNDRACEHGYLVCRRCEDAATERAKKVADHYRREQQRTFGGDLNGTYPNKNQLRQPAKMSCSCGNALGVGETRCRRCKMDGFFGVYPRLKQDARCGCGSRLQATEAIATGKCHWCRTGTTPSGWTGKRCSCGSMLMSEQSVKQNQCSKCRGENLDYRVTPDYHAAAKRRYVK